MNKILILFVHPAFEKSRVQRAMVKQAMSVAGVTFNDLYEHYPDFDIDIEREKRLLAEHDIIVWQHPFYWYSGPALLKQWLDLVLEHGWAYGKHGRALEGKKIFNAFSSGGSMKSYQVDDAQGCTITDLLRPFERTAQLCRMTYLPPFWVPGTHKLSLEEINAFAEQYKKLLVTLRDSNLREEEIIPMACLNDWITINKFGN
jgi:glutathione-regulated potassium-efflux system ancillary protein KefG